MITDRQPGRHLGAPVNPGQASYDFILEKFSNKLTAWKARLLTPAGRVVLIKSVLQSLPVYYMATERIPKKVLSALTSMIRRFFWGANDKDIFMAYVAWDKITQPLQNGGLAIRDLNVVNEALLMKALWKLASNSEAQWVMLVKVKYLPCSHLWNSKRTYNCSIFWKGVMSLREKLWPMIHFEIGDGETCTVFNQPWIAGGRLYCQGIGMPEVSRYANSLIHRLAIGTSTASYRS